MHKYAVTCVLHSNQCIYRGGALGGFLLVRIHIPTEDYILIIFFVVGYSVVKDNCWCYFSDFGSASTFLYIKGEVIDFSPATKSALTIFNRGDKGTRSDSRI